MYLTSPSLWAQPLAAELLLSADATRPVERALTANRPLRPPSSPASASTSSARAPATLSTHHPLPATDGPHRHHRFPSTSSPRLQLISSHIRPHRHLPELPLISTLISDPRAGLLDGLHELTPPVSRWSSMPPRTAPSVSSHLFPNPKVECPLCRRAPRPPPPLPRASGTPDLGQRRQQSPWGVSSPIPWPWA
jgi:hypothetical protein